MINVAERQTQTYRKPRNIGSLISRGLAWAALLLLVVFTVFPILVMVTTSLKTVQEANNNTSLLPQSQWRWQNYPDMWNVINFGNYFKNSLIICGTTMVVATLLATFASYPLARFKFPGKDLFSISVLGTQLIPGIMFLIPLYLFFKWIRDTFGLPLINSYLGMIILYTAFFLPLSLWILRGFFASIPPDLEEQAMVDGCNRFQAFYKVVLPLAAPGIAATAIYIFLSAWDELLFAWVMTTTDGVQTVPVGIRLYLGQIVGGQNHIELAMAAAVVVTLPIMLIFFFIQRYMISGLTAGAVKLYKEGRADANIVWRQLQVGGGDLGLPDRGGSGSGRQGREHLGSLQPHTRQDQRQHERRRSLRSLQPLAARPRPGAEHGAEQLPLLHRLAAHPA